MSADLHIMVTNRGIEGIAQLHRFPLEAFEGLTIYDLGCGMSDIGADLAINGIKATVIGFDEDARALNTTQGHERSTEKRFARLDKLPVADQSADIAIATYSMPLYGRNPDQIRGFFREAERVVRLGGLLSIYPAIAGLSNSYRDVSSFASRYEATQTEVARIRNSSDWLSFALDREAVTAQKIN